MNKLANHQFRLSVLSLDARHHSGALFGRNDIHQFFHSTRIFRDIAAQAPGLSDRHFLINFVIAPIRH